MKWYKNLYVGEAAFKDRRSIIRNIKKSKFQLVAYVLALPEASDSVLDIYPAFVLLQPDFKERELSIVGIALDKDEAFKVMENIVMDCFKKTGHFKVQEFLTAFR